MPVPGDRPVLLLGPLLRHVDPVSATVWVEVDRPCSVEVLGRRARTFCVGGHHYALVVIEGLEPGSTTAYDVRLDGEPVWPEPSSTFPPPRIRTAGRPGSFRLAFGSCRYATPSTVDASEGIPPDALDTYAAHIAGLPEDQWPDAVVLLGDQVYADELTPGTKRWLSLRRDLDSGPGAQTANYEEYTRLYAESWSDPQVRWLLSTIPSSMIFDDHEMIDDWNTSAAWRARVEREPWWTERIVGGLSSYWVYQHLGNLSPDELATNKTWQAILGLPEDDDDAEPILREMAERADAEPSSIRWSFVRHWGGTRLVMVDSRAGRVLAEQERRMLDD
jgi:phosphodiesterase/alkaline phosphatase D-like protein